MTGLLLGLAVSLCLGVADFLGGTLARRVPLLTVLVLSQAVTVLVTLPRLLVPEPAGDPVAAIGWGAVGGVAVAVGVSSLYRALAIGTMGVVAPLAGLSVLVPLIAGLADGEPLTVLMVVGMVAAIVGTVLAAGPQLRPPARTGAQRLQLQAIGLALLSALGFGVSNLAVAWGSAHRVTPTLLANAVTALLLYAALALARRHVPRANGGRLVGIAAIGVLGFGANLCFALASLSGSLSVVAVLAALFPAVTALLGWWVHRERISLVQAVGVLLVLVGVSVMAAGGGAA